MQPTPHSVLCNGWQAGGCERRQTVTVSDPLCHHKACCALAPLHSGRRRHAAATCDLCCGQRRQRARATAPAVARGGLAEVVSGGGLWPSVTRCAITRTLPRFAHSPIVRIRAQRRLTRSSPQSRAKSSSAFGAVRLPIFKACIKCGTSWVVRSVDRQGTAPRIHNLSAEFFFER